MEQKEQVSNSSQIAQNGLLAAVKSDEVMLNYIQKTHATQIREDVFNVVRLYTDTLPSEQKAEIWSMLINGS